MRKVLLVEDDRKVARLVREILCEPEFELKVCESAESCLELMPSFQPNLVVLDIHLPGMNGFQFCARIKKTREWKQLPVLMVSGEAVATDDKVSGLKTGADDYLVKPFAPAELLERVRALLRRSMDEGDPGAVLMRGGIMMDLKRRAVSCGDRKIELTLKEFELLAALMKAQGRVIKRADLLRKVWGYRVEINSRTVDMHVASLRSKLGDCARSLKTEEAIGYSFE